MAIKDQLEVEIQLENVALKDLKVLLVILGKWDLSYREFPSNQCFFC